jgi:hypothetical protein
MLLIITAWAAAHSDFLAAAALAVVGIIVCTLVFPQDGSGGDFGFGDCGGE